MDISCKVCARSSPSVGSLLNHYHLKHYTQHSTHTCIFPNCPRTFKTFHSLRSHVYRNHDSASTNDINDIQFFVCPYCKKRIELGRNNVASHLIDHLNSSSGVIECPISNCTTVFSIANSFRSHLHRQHHDWSINNLKISYSLENSDQHELGMDPVSPHPFPDDEIYETEDGLELSDENQVEFLSNLVLKMEAQMNITQTAISELLQDILQLLKLNNNYRDIELKKFLCGKLKDVEMAHVKRGQELISSPVEDALKSRGILSSDHLRKNYLMRKHSDLYIKPEEYFAYNDEGKVVGKYMYTPILKVLGALLTHDEVLEDVKSIHVPQEDIISAYEDGESYKSRCNLDNGEIALKLKLYMDEVQMTDPLGVYRNKHKISGFYWSLLNIKPHHRSVLHAIQVAILINYKVLKQCNIQSILSPMIFDLQMLENTGIYVPKLGKTLKGFVCFVSGDHLSSNFLSGMTTDFSSPNSQPCRMCNGKIKDFYLGPGCGEPRTKEVYEANLQELKANNLQCLNGIKREGAFSKIESIRCTVSYPDDKIHSILEGDAPYEIALCFEALSKSKIFTRNEIVDIIHNFPYVGQDKVNKPVINPNFYKNNTIGGNACTNWNLLRLLPVIFYGKIPDHFKHWELLMLLKEILEIVSSPILHCDSVDYLSYLVNCHRELFIEIEPGRRLKYKQHQLDHLVEQVRSFGPMSNTDVLREEAKHSDIKGIIKRSHNFKNPLKHACEKHALQLLYHLNSASFFKCDEFPDVVHVSIFDLSTEQREAIIKIESSVTVVSAVQHCMVSGHKYREDKVILLKSDLCTRTFGVIHNIFLIEGDIYLWCHTADGFYDEKYALYELVFTKHFELRQLKRDSLPQPLELYYKQDFNKYFISLQRSVVNVR